MARYVKFMRGTADAFVRLTQKDNDTLYFIYENEASGTGLLYLGNKLIAGGGVSDLSTTSIDALKDVLITEGLSDKSLLVYDAKESLWINKTLDEAISVFIGAGSSSNGKAGLVPAPLAGQTNMFLRSDGTWAAVEASGQAGPQIFNVINEGKQPHAEVINEALVGLDIHKGDLFIITDKIGSNYNQQAAYVYDNQNWIPLNSNVVSSEQVIFASSDQTLDEIITSILDKPEIVVDNISIAFDNNILSLKNYGVKYYRFVAATEDVNAHYEPQIVDDNHPWASGLEPRVVEENGELVLGWYEPNTTTIDAIQNKITLIQDDITEINEALGTKANANDVYTKLQVEEKIAAAAHLKRKEVESIEDIDVNSPDADQYIYMVPSGLKEDDNKYYEYIVIELEVYDEETDSKIPVKRVEKVGSWEVNLNDYAKISDVNTALEGKVDKIEDARLITKPEIEKINSIIDLIKSTDEHFTVGNSGRLNLNNLPIAKITNLEDTLNKKVDKVEGWALLSPEQQTKLNSLAFITSVNEDQFSLAEGQLNIKNISTDNITGLEELLNAKASVVSVETLKTSLTFLADELNSYKTNTNAKLDELDERMTWQNLI